LKRKYDELLSSFATNFNLRLYSKAADAAEAAAGVEAAAVVERRR